MGFFGRSLLLLLALYGLVFVIGDLALVRGQAPIWAAFLFVFVMIGLPDSGPAARLRGADMPRA